MSAEKPCKWMTVIEDTIDSTSEFKTINLYDVDYIESENRRLVYYIGDKRYLQITKLSEMHQVLNEQDGFVSLDRTNLVNLNHVKEYDEKLGNVYFDHKQEGERTFATIAKMKQKILSPLIHRTIANNFDLQRTTTIKSEPKQRWINKPEKE
ncbi:LytTR family transcriptional regulator [Virgibacillus sp. MSP4-1]|uniref:LytTR family transcriptional regulator DNA-binding domain-containing protein n=1 Tax=Virgibacillus sp. MSP4-1 TaxID=2700081 RepID=UPI00039EAA4B|nr:LytTR family transcriptional regulator DNA-binding domain-containing protein [Virgibacillus sp. MSP4-1]QHS24035.1 LytTR family transcriptional regulator [Virgibacillus sp. MSP4-1]